MKLIHNTILINIENIMRSKINQTQKDKYRMILLLVVPRTAKFIKTESEIVELFFSGHRVLAWGSKNVLEMDSGGFAQQYK